MGNPKLSTVLLRPSALSRATQLSHNGHHADSLSLLYYTLDLTTGLAIFALCDYVLCALPAWRPLLEQ